MADEAVLKLPMDYQQSVAFRRLALWFGEPGDVVRANHVYTTLWTELAYLAREGRQLGALTPEEAPALKRALAAVTDRVEELYAALADGVRLLVKDGAGGTLVCPQFIALNSHLGPGGKLSQASMGGVMKAFWKQAERAQTPGYVQMVMIPADKLVDAAGEPIVGDLVDRMRRTVILCDSALGKRHRPPYLYSADLIAHAVAVCRAMNDKEILEVCAYLAKSRKHPMLEGLQTEALLPRFGDIIKDMNGVA